MRAFATICAIVMSLAWPGHAVSGPEVVASIAPVHSLAARVMQGAGTPRLLLPPGVSPHDYALRPSDAAALERAALVIRIGPQLESWLERPLRTLAPNAVVLRLDAVAGLTRLRLRRGAAFEQHDPVDGEADPHLWLDPENAKLWLDAIAAALVGIDPSRQARYLANAAEARSELDRLVVAIETRLGPLRGRPFIVLHDAFHYFEHRFDIEAAGAVALSDARRPGPARIAAIRARIAAIGAVCLFGEPQLRTRLLTTVAEGTVVRIGVLDPLGAGLAPGPGLYPALIEGLAEGLAECLGE